jgi:hypothetical protein
VDWGQDGTAFRAQLVVPEQRQLYDYWLAKSDGAKMPLRNAIKPVDLPRMLAGMSLIEVSSNILQSRVRLAGTRLREIYDREITGLTLGELDWADKQAYWLAAYERTMVEGIPTQGVVRGPRIHKEHMVQYWLRLPLRTTGENASIILGFDVFLAASDRLEENFAVSA